MSHKFATPHQSKCAVLKSMKASGSLIHAADILPFRAGKLLDCLIPTMFELFDCLIRRASVFHQHTKVRGVRRPTFTSTRRDSCFGLLIILLQLPKNI